MNQINQISKELRDQIIKQVKGNRKITFLVGAGLSAESGIPTFRDKDGFWTVGSKNYTPQEIGTKKMFDVNFNEVWRWYLYRISICNQVNPNDGHKKLSKIEKLLKNRFALISQNVDGLHFREESKIKNLYLIHGDLRFMRCSEECSRDLYPIPKEISIKERTSLTPISYEEIELLKCPKCESETRPHVLWFDEYYNEHHYHLHKVLGLAKETGLLFVVGTSGATTLPRKIIDSTISRQGIVIDINPNDNLFTDQLERVKNGYRIRLKSVEALNELYEIIKENIEN